MEGNMKNNSAVRRGVLATAALAVCLSSLVACGDDDKSDEGKDDAAKTEITQDGKATIGEITGCLSDAGFESTPIEETPAGLTAPAEGISVELPTDKFDDQSAAFWVFESAEDVEANRLAITLAPIDTPSSVVKANLVVKYVYPVAGDEPWVEEVTGCIDAVTV